MKIYDTVSFTVEGPAYTPLHGVIEQLSEEEANVHFINLKGETTSTQTIPVDQLTLSTSPVWATARDLWVERRKKFKNRVDGYMTDLARLIRDISVNRDVDEETVSHIINDWHKWQHANPSPEI